MSVGQTFAQSVEVSWTGSTESDLAGYKVYYGSHSKAYSASIVVGLNINYELTVLPDYSPVYFAVTAYDADGNESDYSTEAVIENDGPFFQLSSNYPNPFNPTTHIPYRLMQTNHVHLAIYDVLGRRVKLLQDGPREAGRYVARWDGDDEFGFPVANGIYFCRLMIGDFCITRKVMLAR